MAVDRVVALTVVRALVVGRAVARAMAMARVVAVVVVMVRVVVRMRVSCCTPCLRILLLISIEFRYGRSFADICLTFIVLVYSILAGLQQRMSLLYIQSAEYCVLPLPHPHILIIFLRQCQAQWK